jgi:hypothetical protein
LGTLVISFGINVLFVALSLIDPTNGCHKLYIKHTFASAGIITPLEIVVFIAISAYANYIADERAAKMQQEPPNEPTPNKKEEEKEVPTIVVNGVNEREEPAANDPEQRLLVKEAEIPVD